MSREIFIKIIRQDKTLIKDSKRLKSILLDHQQDIERPYLNAIILSQSEGIVPLLVSLSDNENPDVLVNKLSKLLQDKSGLKDDIARWAVESWALALGLVLANTKMSHMPKIADITTPFTFSTPYNSPNNPKKQKNWLKFAIVVFVSIVYFVSVTFLSYLIVAYGLKTDETPEPDIQNYSSEPTPSPIAEPEVPQEATLAPEPEIKEQKEEVVQESTNDDTERTENYYIMLGDKWRAKGKSYYYNYCQEYIKACELGDCSSKEVFCSEGINDSK